MHFWSVSLEKDEKCRGTLKRHNVRKFAHGQDLGNQTLSDKLCLRNSGRPSAAPADQPIGP